MASENTGRYRIPTTVENAAKTLGCSPSLVRLVIDCCCPTQEGKIIPVAVTNWLLDNVNIFRERAGLSNLPPLLETDDADKIALFRLRNVLLTITEYQGSRSSDPGMKLAYERRASALKDEQRGEI